MKNLYPMTVGSIVIVMILFSVIVQLIGYFAFSRSFESEYSDFAMRSANISTELVDGDSLEGYLNYSQEELEKVYRYSTFSAYSRDYGDKADLDEYMYGQTYGFSKEGLDILTSSMGLSVIYVIIPDKDYKHYTCIFNCVNEDSGYTPWKLGRREEAYPDYYEKYKNIMENGSEGEIVKRIKDLGDAKPHITALVPIYDKEENVVGILCVQRFVDELVKTRKAFVQGVGAIAVILIIIIMLFESQFLRVQVIKPIDRIAREAERFAQGGKDGKFPIPGGLGSDICKVNEIRSLAESIDNMENDTLNIIEYITEMTREKERVDSDISLARKIQLGMLPQKYQLLEEKDEFDIGVLMRPAREVGGDFYDFFMIDDDHLALIIADVSDKGIGAAFFMAMSKTLIKARAKMGGSAAEIIQYVDELIQEKNPQGMFVTVWFGIVDLESGIVNVCNAGHDYPAIMQGGEDYKIEKMPHGPAVGFLPGMQHTEYEMKLNPGDRIFLYTDGVNEAKRTDGARFGIERMLRLLNSNKETDNDTLVLRMKLAVDNFAGEEPQFDDMTMLSFTYIGKKLKLKSSEDNGNEI